VSSEERNEELFQKLPPLDSQDYLMHLKSASARDLPAPVLVRAYRQLRAGPAAEATLTRLLGHNEKYGYITPLYRAAERLVTRHDAYGVDDLVQDTIGRILDTLGGPQGEGADKAWVKYLRQRLIDAHREHVGRRNERRPRRAEPVLDEETGEIHDPIDVAGVTRGPFQGNPEPNDLEWLEDFIGRTFSKIEDERLRQVAFDMIAENPTPVSSKDPTDTNTLEHRFQVNRYTIYRLQRLARVLLYAALQTQTERPGFNTDFLKEP
jgi:DNA-directed RNA polymerase specialized sigma24 family protein